MTHHDDASTYDDLLARLGDDETKEMSSTHGLGTSRPRFLSFHDLT